MIPFKKFVNEYYTPVPHHAPGMVRLYRGDSSYIDQFDPDKFELDSMYGPGSYLTDHRHVAFTYTTKGDKGKVLYSFDISDDNAKKKKFAVLYFICNYLMFKLAGKPVPNEDYDYMSNNRNFDMEPYNYFELKRHQMFNDWSLYGEDEDEDDRQRYAKVYAERRAEHEAMETKFGDMFNAAVQHMKQYGYRYKFVMVRGGYEPRWEVIDATKKQGHISEFDVPKALVENCYDAEAPLDEQVLKLVSKCWTMHGKEVQKTPGAFVTEDHLVPLQRRYKHYWHGIKTFSDLRRQASEIAKWSLRTWTAFIKGMKALGYTGIRYLGGKITDNPVQHNAYVLWDFEQLKRVR